MTAKQRSIVAMFGALAYALLGFRVFLSSAVSVATFVDMRASGSAGLGAVSIGISEAFVELAVPMLGSIVINWMLRGWARGSDSAKTLHRTQKWSIVLAFAVALAMPFFPIPGALAWVPLGGLAWGASLLLTAALLGTYALRASGA
jgi:hypothetical protein